MNWMTVVVADPFKAMFIKICSYIPTLIVAIVILIVGWMIAKLLEAVVIRALKAVRLDVASDKAGLSNILAQGDIKLTLSELLGAIIYWLVVLVVIATALNALNLTIAAEIISRLIGYVPNIIAAIFVLVLGSFLASFVASIVRTSASNAGIRNAKLLSKVTQVVLSLLGGGMLMWLGITMFSTRLEVVQQGKDLPYSAFVAGIITSGLNPFFLLWWATIGSMLIMKFVTFGKLGLPSLIAVHWLCGLG